MEASDNREWHLETDHHYGSPERLGTSGGSPKSHHSANSEMLDLKLGRKKAESELQQLANRVALLKMEEHKAQEKVKETKLRAAEIVE
ncbi:hypothetical protein EON65_51815 [archaeon]|nr:MAG: hypothetical protein EON65_51815 [archaeon]